MTRGKIVLAILFVLALGTLVAQAQLPTATILGVVKDSSGASVPDTALTARNVDTGQTRAATSAADGSYRFSALPVGNYEVRAAHPGFQTEARSGLTLAVSQEAVVNFSLQVGAVEQTVSVTAEAPLVNTTSGSLGGLVDEKRVADLPLNGRNYIDLTLLQPGITQMKNLGNNPSGVGLWYTSNGAPIRSANNYMLDGALLANMQGVNTASLSGSTLGVDGIREFRVITNAFSAEYGMTMGSQLVMVSKGGTNQFHGDVFEYLRNSALDARNFFDYKSAAFSGRLPPYKRNQFGGAFGGPIKKDKTFIWGVYEALRQRLGLSIIDNVMGAGCHGPAGATITVAACPQLGSVSQVTIAPVIAPLLALYPLPNLPNNAFTLPFSSPTRDDYGQMRVDHTFSANDTMFARYTIDDAEVTTAVTSGGIFQSYPGFAVLLRSRNQYATLSEDHVFSPALLNTARFSYSRTSPNTDSHGPYSGPQYAFYPPNSMEMGAINIGGLSPLGPHTTTPSYFPQNLFTWSDDLFYSRGKHSLKFGTLINRFQQYNYTAKGARGSATFPNLAGFLLGQPQTYTEASITGRTYRYSTLGFYAQDDFRVSSRLTLNLGLRYEFMTQLHEKYGVSAAVRNLLTDTSPTVGIPFVNPSKHNFSPRLGFAWDVNGNGKTAIRGGFALLYDLAPYGTSMDLYPSNNKPFSFGQTVVPAAGTVLTIPFTFTPQNVTPVMSQFDYNMKQEHLLSYNLALERQLPGSMALTLAYAGSRGYNLMGDRDGNPTIPSGVPVNGVCVARPSGQAYDNNQPYCWMGNDPYRNPNFASITPMQTAAASSWYNAFQFGLLKRLSRGLQFQSSYTWSKLIDTPSAVGSTVFSSSPVQPTDILHPNVDRGLSALDVAHNLRFNAIYQLPSVASGVLGKVVNGWQASGILSLQTGSPFTVNLSANRSRSRLFASAANTDRPNLVAGRSNDNIVSGTTAGCLGVAPGQKLGTPNLYFDPGAFAIQPIGFLGNAGRNILRGPGLANMDFSLVKNTALKLLGEAGRVEFRAEFFNILNRANFLTPARIAYAGTADVQAALSNAGVITSTGTASRQIQFALKVVF